MVDQKYKIKILPAGREIEVDGDRSLLVQLKDQGFYVKSSCGGVASCADCIIKVNSGAEFLNGPSFDEVKLLGNVFHLTKERLSCQTKVKGPVTIDLSAQDKNDDAQKMVNKSTKVFKGMSRLKKKGEGSRGTAYPKPNQQNNLRPGANKDWYKPWDPNNTQGGQVPSGKIGGNRRPKQFSTDDKVENSEEE